MTASTTTAPTTAAVAQELVSLVRNGKTMECLNKLYSPNIVSIEPADFEKMPAEQKGIDAVRGKNEWWFANNELHSLEANGPFLGQDQFAVQYKWDTTFKPTGQRQVMREVAVYTVKDGKIVREEFFYNASK
jgi:ketosteroid isomerase-like protein